MTVKTRATPVIPSLERPCRDALEAGQILREEITRAFARGDKLYKIAKRAKLSQSTVSRLYYGETKFPRYETISKLMRVFNLALYIRRTNQ